MTVLIFAAGRAFSVLVFVFLRRTMLFFIALRNGMSLLVLLRVLFAVFLLVPRNISILVLIARTRIQGTTVSVLVFALGVFILVSIGAIFVFGAMVPETFTFD